MLDKLLTQGKLLMLAYDQGFEHGPEEFNDQNVDPAYILQIALDGGYSCIALQHGIAEDFWKGEFQKVPLVVKLNGKTNMGSEMYSVANSTVSEAAALRAAAVGYTIYLGSPHEAEMIKEFSEIRRQAHEQGLAVFAWMYPFLTPPSSNDDERDAEVVAYAARVGAELGADVLKIKYPNQPDKLSWIVENALQAKVMMSGGDPEPEERFLAKVSTFIKAGGAGLAVGRNVWKHQNPLELTKQIKQIIWA